MSILTRLWHRLHCRLAAQQRRRTGDALVIVRLRERITAEEAETARIAKKIAAAKRIAAAILAGHAAAKAAKAAQVSASNLRVFWFNLNGMDCYYGAN